MQHQQDHPNQGDRNLLQQDFFSGVTNVGYDLPASDIQGNHVGT